MTTLFWDNLYQENSLLHGVTPWNPYALFVDLVWPHKMVMSWWHFMILLWWAVGTQFIAGEYPLLCIKNLKTTTVLNNFASSRMRAGILQPAHLLQYGTGPLKQFKQVDFLIYIHYGCLLRMHCSLSVVIWSD